MKMVGYDPLHLTRPVMYRECEALIRKLGPERLDALEISAGKFFSTLGFKLFQTADYPEFDVCKDVLDRQFDIVIADQVWEHLLYPYRATRNVLAMLRPGGHFLVTTPFLIRVHAVPHDCTRWTETGMRYFLTECGFEEASIVTGSWGNRSAVKANLNRWARAGWRNTRLNEPDFPIVVWALARKPLLSTPK